jgi:hypothetical protein
VVSTYVTLKVSLTCKAFEAIIDFADDKHWFFFLGGFNLKIFWFDYLWDRYFVTLLMFV